MSLLLDALKKAAEQKSKKDGTSSTELDQPDPTVMDTSLNLTESSDQTEASETALNQTESDESSWTFDNTALDITETQTDMVDRTNLDYEMEAFLESDTQAAHAKSKKSTVTTVSLTENLEKEKKQYNPSPAAAASMFRGKSALGGDNDKNRKIVLYGLLVIGSVIVGGMFFYDYLETASDISAAARNRVTTPRRSEDIIQQQNNIAQAETSLTSPELLIEKEDYTDLIEDEPVESKPASLKNKAIAKPTTPIKSKPNKSKSTKPKPKKVAATKPKNKSRKERKLNIIKQTPTSILETSLIAGFNAYQIGDYDRANHEYHQAIEIERGNIDALLGLAAVAVQKGDYPKAKGYYFRVLQLDPKNSYASAGLSNLQTGLKFNQNLNNDESQLKLMINEQPESAILHYALGNLYASQHKWSAAQQSYFSALSKDSENPDFLFNLAVSLDHLGKKELALRFYQESLLAMNKRIGNFDTNGVNKRVEILKASNSE